MIYSKVECLDMVLQKSYGTDPALACAIIHSLSQWLPGTVNSVHSDIQNSEPGNDTTYGLFQFTGQQARQAGYKGKLQDLIDAQVNIEVGVQLLRMSLERAGNRAEPALLSFLGRSRAQMIPGIVSLIPQYQELIGKREA